MAVVCVPWLGTVVLRVNHVLILSGKCVISSVLSCHNKNLKWWTSSWMDHCYSSVLFRKQRKIHPQGVRTWQPKRWKERETKQRETDRESERESDRDRETPWTFDSSFYMFFLLPLGLPYVNWASQECCMFYWGPYSRPRALLCSIFKDFSLLWLLTAAIFDSFFLF